MSVCSYLGYMKLRVYISIFRFGKNQEVLAKFSHLEEKYCNKVVFTMSFRCQLRLTDDTFNYWDLLLGQKNSPIVATCESTSTLAKCEA